MSTDSAGSSFNKIFSITSCSISVLQSYSFQQNKLYSSLDKLVIKKTHNLSEGLFENQTVKDTVVHIAIK